MFEALADFVAAHGSSAAGSCAACEPQVLWTLAASQALIGISCLSIALAVTAFAARRKQLPYRRLFVMFSVFMFASGAVCFVQLLGLWQPLQHAAAALEAATAVAALATAGALRSLVPRALAFPSRDDLERSNQALVREVQARMDTEQVLRGREEQYRQLSGTLERRVAERTRELEAAIAALQGEVEERSRMQRQLQEVNGQLSESLSALEARTAQLEQLNQMSELLQSTSGIADSCELVARFARGLFPEAGGSVLLMDEHRRVVEAQASWGTLPVDDLVFAPDECWAIRRSALHPGNDAQSGLRCAHVRAHSGAYVCVPLIANGETLGLLHLRGSGEQIDSHARAILGTMAERVALALANLRRREDLLAQSVRDGLTGLYNRRFLDSAMQLEERRARRSARPFGVLILDLDQFKPLNDRFGHDAGDSVLRDLARILQAQTRGGDLACRYGGEEFVIIMPGAALEATVQRAEQLHAAILETRFRHLGRLLGTVTASIGVAAFPLHGESWAAVLREADQALYRAKRAGRNRVEVAGAAQPAS
jgi:diguanylate cyclase (GGDEF)-like protein